jgi:hypothetical protein
MTISPYTNRAALRNNDDFFGRRRELHQIYTLILKGLSISLVGERRVGKSSILFALQFEEKRREFSVPDTVVFVSINGQYFVDSEEGDVIEYLLDQTAQEAGTSTHGTTRDLLRQMGRELLDTRPRRQLVVLMDEVDVLVHNEKIAAKFFSFLRAWTEEFQIPFVIASREGSIEGLVETEGAGSPFWNIFKSVYVGPMERAEADDLVRMPASRLALPFTDEEVTYLFSLGGYQPFFLQIACDHLFTAKSQDPVVDFDKVTQAFRSEAYPHVEYLLRRLPSSERDALAVFAQTQSPPDRKGRSELLRKGVLVQDTAGLRLFSSVLSDLFTNKPNLKSTLAQKANDLLFG